MSSDLLPLSTTRVRRTRLRCALFTPERVDFPDGPARLRPAVGAFAIVAAALISWGIVSWMAGVFAAVGVFAAMHAVGLISVAKAFATGKTHTAFVPSAFVAWIVFPMFWRALFGVFFHLSRLYVGSSLFVHGCVATWTVVISGGLLQLCFVVVNGEKCGTTLMLMSGPVFAHLLFFLGPYFVYAPPDAEDYSPAWYYLTSTSAVCLGTAAAVFEIGRASVGKECRSRWSPYH